MSKVQRYFAFLASAFIPFTIMLYLYGKNIIYISLAQVLAVSLVFCLISALIYFLIWIATKSYIVCLLGCILFWILFFYYGSFYKIVVADGIRHRYLLPIYCIVIFAIVILTFQISEKFKPIIAIGCILLWSAFLGYNYTYKLINSLIQDNSADLHVIFLLLFLMLLLSILVLIQALLRKTNSKVVCSFICVMLSFLFVYNASHAIYLHLQFKSNSQITYKTSFVVNESLSTPNVYWFHCDGMMGFDAIEEYFGDPQIKLTKDLKNRGFVINREARFAAGNSTMIAVPTLMSPTFYDNTLYQDLCNNNFPDQKQLSDARSHLELVKAFSSRGYATGTVSYLSSPIFYPNTNTFFAVESPSEPNRIIHYDDNPEKATKFFVSMAEANQLLYLLSDLSAVSAISPMIQKKLYSLQEYFWKWEILPPTDIALNYMPNYIIRTSPYTYTAQKGFVDGVFNIMDMPTPRFSILNFSFAHFPFLINENGEEEIFDNNSIINYLPQHEYCAAFLINVIDAILEKDPDAVIVLQADHGIHNASYVDSIVKELSIPESDITLIQHSVMSAVRIPSKYGDLKEPLNPLNISRYLVNQYVGENYSYLNPDDSDFY